MADFFQPEEYTEGGQSNAPDYTTYESDNSGPPLNWRLWTPPPGYDGTVENVADTVSPP